MRSGQAQSREYEYIDWQWPLSFVHSVMMAFSAQLAEDGGTMHTPFQSIVPLLFSALAPMVVYKYWETYFCDLFGLPWPFSLKEWQRPLASSNSRSQGCSFEGYALYLKVYLKCLILFVHILITKIPLVAEYCIFIYPLEETLSPNYEFSLNIEKHSLNT